MRSHRFGLAYKVVVLKGLTQGERKGYILSVSVLKSFLASGPSPGMEREFMTEERKVSDSIVETVHLIRPNHMNAAGRLFGGMLMQWLDEVAGLVAKRHTRSNVITASVDNLRFIHGAYDGEMVVIIGKATYVGNTSMEVRVDTYVENLQDGMRHPINRAYFTMVALDENDRPKRVPRLILETEAEKGEWEAAEKRRQMRMQRKAEGF